MTHSSGLMGGFPTRQTNRWALGGALEASWFTQSIPEIVETITGDPNPVEEYQARFWALVGEAG